MIKIKKFDKMIERAKKKATPGEVEYMKKYINIVYKIMNRKIREEIKEADENDKNQNIDESIEKAEISAQNILNEILMKISYYMPTEGEAHLLNGYQELLYNHEKRKQIYNKIKGMSKEELEERDLVDNIDGNEEVIAKEILYLYRKSVEKFMKSSEYLKKSQTRRLGREQERFENIFNNARGIFSENIRNKYINSLIIIGEILERFGFVEDYEKRQNIEYEKSNINSEKVELNQYFNKDFLKSLSIKQLIAMNVFWSNRLTKEIEDINTAIFILHDLKILSTYGSSNSEDVTTSITEEELKQELIKTSILQEISSMYIQQVNSEAEEKQQHENQRVKIVDVENYIKPYIDIYKESYKQYFGMNLRQTENDLKKDIENVYAKGRNIVNNLYESKNATVLALVESCITRDTIQNWGYIEEDNNVGNFIILGFDIEGLNMPLRIHIPKGYLKEFLKANEMENIIPIYKGNEDFMRLGESIKTPALIPMNKKIKTEIEDMEINRKGSVQQAMYLEHLKYLANTTTENFPQHLKTPKVVGKGKKQKVKYLIKREYIDIDTKQKYEIDKEGKYIQISERRER